MITSTRRTDPTTHIDPDTGKRYTSSPDAWRDYCRRIREQGDVANIRWTLVADAMETESEVSHA
jgi:hypothetical protein